MNKLLAPNGKTSYLTPEQYKLVRTPAFKKWFGDWENDPANSSKVIDKETKEPLVVFHGTYLTNGFFNEFNNVSYFTDNIITANEYPIASYILYETFDEYVEDSMIDEDDIEKLKKDYDVDNLKKGNVMVREDSWNTIWEYYDSSKLFVYKCFLNLRNPKIIENADDEDVTSFSENDKRISEIKNENYDSVIGIYPYKWFSQDKINYHNENIGDYEKETHYITFNSNQIKLADGTNTTFDSGNSDIRYAGGGELDMEKVEKIKNIILKNYPHLESLDFIGKGLYGYAFITEINNELYVVKYSTSLTEYWVTKMASVSNPPNVVKFEEVKEISDNFEYIIIHKWLNRDAMPNKNAWEVALGNTFKGYREGIKFIDKKELEYVMNLSKKLSKSLEDYFGFTIDTNQDNWGYDENNKLLLFDLDGNVSKSQYEEWMNKYSNNSFDDSGVIVGENEDDNKFPTREEAFELIQDSIESEGTSFIDEDGDGRFESKEQAQEYVDEIYDFFDYYYSLGMIPIYRVVATDEVDLDPYSIGESWSLGLDYAKNFGSHLGGSLKELKIISGYVPNNNADWESAFRLFPLFSDFGNGDSEFELPIPSNNRLINIKVSDYKDAKELEPYKNDNSIDNSNVIFNKGGEVSTGLFSQIWEWFGIKF